MSEANKMYLFIPWAMEYSEQNLPSYPVVCLLLEHFVSLAILLSIFML
jgi:hypothetical protein